MHDKEDVGQKVTEGEGSNLKKKGNSICLWGGKPRLKKIIYQLFGKKGKGGTKESRGPSVSLFWKGKGETIGQSECSDESTKEIHKTPVEYGRGRKS